MGEDSMNTTSALEHWESMGQFQMVVHIRVILNRRQLPKLLATK
jgi:hypothetical protein